MGKQRREVSHARRRVMEARFRRKASAKRMVRSQGNTRASQPTSEVRKKRENRNSKLAVLS